MHCVGIWNPNIYNITVTGNYFGPSLINRTDGTNCSVVRNTWVPAGDVWPPEAEAIKTAAGVLPSAKAHD